MAPKKPAAPPSTATLVDVGSEERRSFAASELWRDSDAVVLVLRRPGWQICRAEAQRVYARKADFEAKGARLSAVVKEDLPGKDGAPGEVQAFRDYCWPDLPVFLDEKRAFYGALGGGKQSKGSIASFFANLLNPFSQLYKNTKRVPKTTEGNFVGEGFIKGGVYVVKKGAAAGAPAAFAHAEAEIGDHPPTDDLLAALD